MRRTLLAGLALVVCAVAGVAQAAEWRVQRVDTPAQVTVIDTVDGKLRVNAGGLWYAIVLGDAHATLAFIGAPAKPKLPDGALPEGTIATGTRDIARAWLIETHDGKLQTVRLKDDAVFEDLEPRLADLDGDGHDEIIVVKSYLKRGSS